MELGFTLCAILFLYFNNRKLIHHGFFLVLHVLSNTNMIISSVSITNQSYFLINTRRYGRKNYRMFYIFYLPENTNCRSANDFYYLKQLYDETPGDQ